MGLHRELPAIYPILDAKYLEQASDRAVFLRKLIRDLADAGIRILQYRNKTGSEHEILADARMIRDESAGRVLLILNDWPEMALATEFDGVHVGQDDLSPSEARGILGPAKIVGVSTHNEAQVRAADSQSADYIAIGPVFATATKANPDRVVGLEGVRMARSLTKKPLVAIGGITLQNASAVRKAGADSVAVIAAIFSPGGDPAKAAAEFLRACRVESSLPARPG